MSSANWILGSTSLQSEGIILPNSPPQGTTWIDFGDGEEEEKDDAHDGQDDIQMIMMHKSDLN